jgi:hypothetical protein
LRYARAGPFIHIKESTMTAAAQTPKTQAGDMKLEVVVIPVSDVDRAKRFYGGLGWRLDADFASGDWRVIQFTPPGSPCSVIFALSQRTSPETSCPAPASATAIDPPI